MAGYTVVHRTPLDVARHAVSGAERAPFAQGLFRVRAASAVVESPALESPFAFDDLVASWNARLPRDARLKLEARVRSGGEWSHWYTLALAEGDDLSSAERQEDGFGWVDVDTLKLKRKADAFRYRFTISSPRRPALLTLAAVTVSAAATEGPAPFVPGPWVRELKVPPRSQKDAPAEIKSDVCSPTSLGMVLEFWGHRRATGALAVEVRDRASLLYGNWPINAAAAARRGLLAWIARLDGLEALQREVAEGRPVITSVTYGPGELSGSPIKRTNGHILVVIGFTPEGDVITLDPAAPRESVRRIYRRAEFHRAWMLKKRGLAYLIGPLAGRRLSVGIPAADLRAKPRAGIPRLDDAEHLSQLLYGEIVTLRAVKGAWAKVEANEQPSLGPHGAWRGYAGWIATDALHFSLPVEPNVVVRTRQALLQRGEDILMLSVGTRLRRESETKGVSFVRLADGSLGELPSDALYAPPPVVSDSSRMQIVKTAELFLGTSYYWGGRSGVQPDLSMGVDCSGLVSLAYRAHGLLVPRDSHEQKLKSRPLESAALKPGDLVFLTDGERARRVTHVMIYTGGDGVIESRKSSGRVLRSTFRERFGKSLSEIRSGEAVVDFSLPKPRRRLIYFGTYL